MKTIEQVHEEAVKVTISKFLQMNIENPKAPVNIDEVKRRAIHSLSEMSDKDMESHTLAVADFILVAMRSYRIANPDANYDDAIGIVMGMKIPKVGESQNQRKTT